MVAGIASIRIEDNVATRKLRVESKISSCVVPDTDLQTLCDRQTLRSFDGYAPEHSFPSAHYI